MRVTQENSHEWRGKSDVCTLRGTGTIEQWSIEVKTFSKSLIKGHRDHCGGKNIKQEKQVIIHR